MSALAFTIPKDADFLKVYKTAKEKGLKVKSRYRGVYLFVELKPSWRAESFFKGKRIYLGHFPFTAQGEFDAAKSYREFKRRIKI